jgi:hypothetical protein
MQTQATELIRQLGEDDHSDPSGGPSLREIASTISQLPVVAEYRQVLQPELEVFQVSFAKGTKRSVALVSSMPLSTILKGLQNSYSTNSDVAPTADARRQYAAQVREYLVCAKAARGLAVYMMTGEVQTISGKTA